MRETHSTNTNAFLRSDEGEMGMTEHASCRTCRYWHGFKHTNYSTGWCRKDAPKIVGTYKERQWPTTSPDDWCGQYDKEPETAEE